MAIPKNSRVALAVLAIFSFFPHFTYAQAASTFYLNETETQFSLNIANDTNDASDINIYFTSPAYSWVGVGFGSRMKDSLMFILYPSSDGTNVTVSPRLAKGNKEPSFYKEAQLELLDGSGIKDEMFVVKARCKFCRAWPGGSIDTSSTAHPMIYAFGHAHRIQSNSLDAGLRRHIRYGHFTMDMVAATGKGEVPPPKAALEGVQLQGRMTRDHDRANLAHAVMGCLALFVLWPINVILVGFFKRIGIHVGVSVFIVVFLIFSYGLGISTSGQFNRSKDFKSPHQIFAFISILPILLLSILPIRPISALHAILPRLHNPLSSLTFIFLVLTGGLGLHLTSQSRPIILAYTAISLLVFLFNMFLQTCIKRRGTAYARATGRRHRNIEEDEENLVLKAYHMGKGSEDYSRSNSQQSVDRPGMHGRKGSGNGNNIYGGGTMPGPQYLLNMHPGVPVHKWDNHQ